MKKILCLVFAAALLFSSFATAEVNVDGMSLADLLELQTEIRKAMWKTKEWQEVEVPQGVYTIGEDIPAGKWTIKPAKEGYINIYWGDELKPSGVEISYKGDICVTERLFDPECRYYRKGDATEVSWNLADGQYIVVDDGIAVFTPYSGKPELGFK